MDVNQAVINLKRGDCVTLAEEDGERWLVAGAENAASDGWRVVYVGDACDGGVLIKAGLAEAAIDLIKLAGLGKQVKVKRVNNNSDCVFIKDLIAWRLAHGEKLVNKRAEVNLPIPEGVFKLHAYRSKLEDDDAHTHVALTMGDIADGEPVLARVHSECFTGDVLGSLRCDCGAQLHAALRAIAKERRGVLLYMRQEGRGIGLLNKLKAYKLQEQGLDTVEANEALGFAPDLREYGTGAQILLDLGVRKLRLLTNNPAKIVGLAGFGLEVVERMPIVIAANEYDEKYLLTKEHRMGHMLNLN